MNLEPVSPLDIQFQRLYSTHHRNSKKNKTQLLLYKYGQSNFTVVP